MQITARHWGIAIAAAVILEVAAAVWLMPSFASPPPPAGGEGIEISLALGGATGNPGAPALEPIAVPQPAPMAIPESAAPEPVTPKPVTPKPVKPKPIKPQPAKTRPPKPTPPPQEAAAPAAPVTRPDSDAATPADSTRATGSAAPPTAPRDSSPAASATGGGGGSVAGTAGAGIAGAEVNYYSQLAAALNRHKRYPYAARRARLEGVVRLRFVIDHTGNVIEHGIAGTSGYPALDQAVVEMLRRANPLPPIPAELHRDQLAIVLPIEFSLRRN